MSTVMPYATARSKISAAMIQACREWPMASAAILSMTPLRSSASPFACAVDQYWRLYYNPDLCEDFAADEFVAVILHEVCHLMLKHHRRAKRLGVDETTAYTWNLATDMAINGQLRSEGKRLPSGVIFAEDYNLPAGQTAELYFRELLKQQEEQQQQQDSSCDNQESEESDDGKGDPSGSGEDSCQAESPSESSASDDDEATGDSQGDDNESGSEQGSDSPSDAGDGGSDQPANGSDGEDDGEGSTSASAGSGNPSDAELTQGAGGGGSSADGISRDWELPPPSESDGATEDTPGMDEGMADQVIKKVAERIAEKMQGSESAGDQFWVDELNKIRVDPKAKILKLVRAYSELAIGHGERTYRRPNRRNATAFARPSNVQPIPRFTIVVDTSGSMGSYEMSLAISLINKIMESFRIRDGIRVVYGDMAVTGQEHVSSNVRSLNMVGRGGTDMGRVIVEAVEQKPKPQMILCVTDGWTDWPRVERMQGVPLVICLTEDMPTPEYAEVIRLFD